MTKALQVDKDMKELGMEIGGRYERAGQKHSLVLMHYCSILGMVGNITKQHKGQDETKE